MAPTALIGKMVGRSDRSVAALAIGEPGMVKNCPAPSSRAGVALAALAGKVVRRRGQSVTAQAVGEPGVIKDSPAPGFRAGVALATLAGIMVRRCGHSVTALAIGKADVVKDRSLPAICASVALATLAGIVIRRSGCSVTALAIGKASVIEYCPTPVLCAGVALAALSGIVLHRRSRSVTVLTIGKASVIEYHRAPSISGMAGGTVYTELIEVDVWLRVTDDARLRGILKNIVYMALIARHLNMCTGQLELGQIVIEGGLLPTVGHVALGTVLSQPSIVGIILLMACRTRWVYFLVPHLAMAVGTGQRHVGPGLGKI